MVVSADAAFLPMNNASCCLSCGTQQQGTCRLSANDRSPDTLHASLIILHDVSDPFLPVQIFKPQACLFACRMLRYAAMNTDDSSSALSLETMQLQWESYVRKLKESGTLSNALAVCDVSGSMSGQPMEVSCPACQSVLVPVTQQACASQLLFLQIKLLFSAAI